MSSSTHSLTVSHRNSHGRIGFKSLAQAISAKWKTISAEEKAICQALADKDRARFLKEMDEYKETHEYLKYLKKRQQQQKKAVVKVPRPKVRNPPPRPLAPRVTVPVAVAPPSNSKTTEEDWVDLLPFDLVEPESENVPDSALSASEHHGIMNEQNLPKPSPWDPLAPRVAAMQMDNGRQAILVSLFHSS